MAANEDLNAVEVTALSKAIAAGVVKAARDELAVGSHRVDLVVHVVGELFVAEDGVRVPTASIPVKEVLALMLARLGCTREAATKLLRECLTEALTHGVRGEDAILASGQIDAVFREAVDELVKSLPPTPVRGAVKAQLVVERVSPGGPSADRL